MTIFGGLFGHDKKADQGAPQPIPLPTAPPVGITGDLASGFRALPTPTAPPASLPPAPPMKAKRAGAFDDEHYQQTMLALAASFFGSNGLGDGLSNAARTIYGANAQAQAVDRPQIGGPDNAFEVYTDPNTGEHRYVPIQSAMTYLEGKREKPKDTADLNGRVMFAISQMDPKDRAAAFAEVKANPDVYGVRAEALPEQWSDTYGNIAGSSGMTVSQAQTRKQVAAAEDHREAHRVAADADRATRTGIYGSRAAAATAQGNARIGIAREGLGLRKQGGGKGGKTHVSDMSEADLLKIALGN